MAGGAGEHSKMAAMIAMGRLRSRLLEPPKCFGYGVELLKRSMTEYEFVRAECPQWFMPRMRPGCVQGGAEVCALCPKPSSGSGV